MKQTLHFIGLALLLACWAPRTQAQWTFSNGYNVLDAANDNTSGITGVTSTNYGNTTGQERAIAYRPAIGADPAIVYIARGGTTTGDGRTGGVIGVSAIKLSAYGASNYTDTGLITSGGTPANFSFIQGMFYEPTCDKVWVIDGSSSTARLWYFSGGSVGGSPSGGGIAVAAAATGITHITQMSNTSGLGGSGRGLAVRVSGDCSTGTVTAAVGMGTHVEVWESTTGMAGPFTMKFESTNDMDGIGTTYVAFTTSTVKDVAFDPEGNIWIVDSGSSKRSIHGFAFASSGTGVAPTQNVQLPRTNFTAIELPGAAANPNSVKFYKDGSYTYALVSMRTGTGEAMERFVRTGASLGSYGFTLMDGFGAGWSGGTTYADAKVQTARYKASSLTQPSGTTAGSQYMSLPYSSSSALELSANKLYLNTFITDTDKGHTKPTSGAYEINIPSLVYVTRTFDGGTGATNDTPTVDKEYLGFSLQTDHGTATVAQMRCAIAASSTATTADVAAVKLWLDVNEDNLIDTGDTQLGTATYDSGTSRYVVTGLSESISTTPKKYIWGVDRVASKALGKTAVTATLALQMAFATTGQDVSVAGGIVSPSNFPIQNDAAIALPVELASFTATVHENSVDLNWQTISEHNTSVIEVLHLVNGEWETVATLSATGQDEAFKGYQQRVSGLSVGTHIFKLKFVDQNGGEKFSAELQVNVEVPGSFVMNPAYPNPFNPQTTITFAVSGKQSVTMTLYNMLGQKVSTLYQGVVEANALQTVQVDGSGLSSGVYLVRLQGESFVGSQRITLVK